MSQAVAAVAVAEFVRILAFTRIKGPTSREVGYMLTNHSRPNLPLQCELAILSACKYGTGLLPRALSTVPPAVKQWVIQSGWP